MSQRGKEQVLGIAFLYSKKAPVCEYLSFFGSFLHMILVNTIILSKRTSITNDITDDGNN